MGSSPTRTISPRSIGEQSELDTFAHLHRCGYTVLICPFRAARYDCVVDDGDELRRVQIKTARLARGQLRWETRSHSPYRTAADSTYQGDEEIWFAVWSPVLRRLWMVPANECGRKESTLRLVPPRSGQVKGIRFADDYEIIEGT